MQRWCEEKKKEGEALQLCLPRKSQPAPLSPPNRRMFAQVTSRPAGVPKFKIPRRPAPQVAAQGPLGSQKPKTHWPRKHVPPAAPPPAKQSDRKKKDCLTSPTGRLERDQPSLQVHFRAQFWSPFTTPPGPISSVVSGPMNAGQRQPARTCAVGSGLQDHHKREPKPRLLRSA